MRLYGATPQDQGCTELFQKGIVRIVTAFFIIIYFKLYSKRQRQRLNIHTLFSVEENIFRTINLIGLA